MSRSTPTVDAPPDARVVTDPARLAAAGRRRARAFASAAGELDAVVDAIGAAGGPNAPGVNLTAIADAMSIGRPTLYRLMDRKGIR